jgi:hypothetical protein
MTFKRRTMYFAFSLFFTLGLVSTAHAQSEIYTVPSATVMDKGSLYCESDANPAISAAASSSFLGRCMDGLLPGLEVGVNGLAVVSKPASSAELQPNIKYQWLNKNGFQLATGLTGFIPVTHLSTEQGFAMVYTVGRYQTKLSDLRAYSPAFSAGAWALLGEKPGTGNRNGAILGVEQPFVVNKSGASVASFVVDWESGKQTHAGFSALTPGVEINLPHNFVVAAGYGFSNLGRKYDAPAIWVGYTFKLRR